MRAGVPTPPPPHRALRQPMPDAPVRPHPIATACPRLLPAPYFRIFRAMPAIRPERSIFLLLLALLIVGLAVGSTYWLYAVQQRVNIWVQHTLRVENQLSTLLLHVQEAESAQRGFMLTRKDSFLGPYEAFRGRWRQELAALRVEVRDNPPQARRSEERRVGKEGVSTCRYVRLPAHAKKKQKIK